MFVHKGFVLLASACALALGGCGGGGGGGGGTNFIPRPPSTPTPSPPPAQTAVLMRSAPASQEFTAKGATFSEVAFPAYDGPLTDSSDQLRIRYDASSQKYEIQAPQTSDWREIAPVTSVSPLGVQWKTDTGDVRLHVNNDQSNSYPDSLYSYSALVEWSRGGGPDQRGVIAFGIATEPSSMPMSGSATYDGSIYGYTTETWDWADWGRGVGTVDGDIQLTFDFASGSLSGSISPRVYVNSQYALPTMNFVETVYSNGSTIFSGKFDTSLTGANAFSGQFTGPQANELIGNFVFPYTSQDNGQVYQAGGGFIAKP